MAPFIFSLGQFLGISDADQIRTSPFGVSRAAAHHVAVRPMSHEPSRIGPQMPPKPSVEIHETDTPHEFSVAVVHIDPVKDHRTTIAKLILSGNVLQDLRVAAVHGKAPFDVLGEMRKWADAKKAEVEKSLRG
jgi:hypothetical protein